MKETSKASLRRSRDPAFVQTYLTGEGLDISPADDPLSAHLHLFPRARRVVQWDMKNGALDDMKGQKEESYDFLHASHCLAETANPAKTLSRWMELLKPGGYAIVTMPDEDLHGKGAWPNRFNRAHKSSFTVCKQEGGLDASVNVVDMVRQLLPVAECERIVLVRENFDTARQQEDQTAKGVAECAIEIVLRKRKVPTVREMEQAIGQVRSAEECRKVCKQALQTYPYRFLMYHRVMTQMLRWDLNEDIDPIWENCVARLPGEHLPRLYEALHLIARGKLQQGFRLRETIMVRMGWKRRTTAQPPSSTPEWTGQSLQGKSIVIWSEFGLGDEIFFLRFARILREQCGASHVGIVCQGPLVNLFTASQQADAVFDVKQLQTMPEYDFWVFPHSIPVHLPLQLDALPQSVPYLHVPDDVPPRVLPGRSDALKVGVVFKGNPTHENDAHRSLPSLAVMDDLFRIEGIDFYSLQKGAGADEAAAYAARLPNFFDVGADVRTMDDTAAAIAQLDVVLTVDTSVAHVAGAMGKPVWLLLPFFGDWRWHYTRSDSPWYPEMRLFRKRANCDWSEVMTRVGGQLLQAKADRHEPLVTVEMS